MADQGIVAIYELRRRGNSSISSSRPEPDVINGDNTRCGVPDHILGLLKDQPAREPSRGVRCGAPGLAQSPLWATTSLLHSRRGGLTLTTSYGIGRLFGVSR